MEFPFFVQDQAPSCPRLPIFCLGCLKFIRQEDQKEYYTRNTNIKPGKNQRRTYTQNNGGYNN